jgi:hypothetical protein
MLKESPQTAFNTIAKNRRRPRPREIYFYDDLVNSRIKGLRKDLMENLGFENSEVLAFERDLIRFALKAATSMPNGRQWLDNYCSTLSRLLAYNPERREDAINQFFSLLEFRRDYLGHLHRMASREEEIAHYSMTILNHFVYPRQKSADVNSITNGDIDALCGLVGVITSKCNGTSAKSIAGLAEFFSKKSFTFKVIPHLAHNLSGLDSNAIPSHISKINCTFA